MLSLNKQLNRFVCEIKPSVALTPSQQLLLTIMDVESCTEHGLAKRLRLSTKTVENLLSGKTQDPQVRTFHKIFHAYCQAYLKRRGL